MNARTLRTRRTEPGGAFVFSGRCSDARTEFGINKYATRAGERALRARAHVLFVCVHIAHTHTHIRVFRECARMLARHAEHCGLVGRRRRRRLLAFASPLIRLARCRHVCRTNNRAHACADTYVYVCICVACVHCTRDARARMRTTCSQQLPCASHCRRCRRVGL